MSAVYIHTVESRCKVLMTHINLELSISSDKNKELIKEYSITTPPSISPPPPPLSYTFYITYNVFYKSIPRSTTPW
jgi:hypothetical protein